MIKLYDTVYITNISNFTQNGRICSPLINVRIEVIFSQVLFLM